MKKIMMMKRFLKISILATIFLWLTSCSSVWHLNRAIKKNPAIVTNKTDTIKSFYPRESKTIYAQDSIIVNERNVFIKVTTSGDSLVLFYEFLPDTVFRIETKTFYNVPKTRQEKRFEYKINRLEKKILHKEQKIKLRKDSKVQIKKAKIESKKSKFSIFAWCVSSFALGFIVAILLVRKLLRT